VERRGERVVKRVIHRRAGAAACCTTLAFILFILAPAGKAWPADCELVIEGDAIEHLVLSSGQGDAQEWNRPGKSDTLPEGRYRVSEVRLQGGFVHHGGWDRNDPWFSVTPEGPNRLQVGAPLVSQLKVERSGRIIKLDHSLWDKGGRKYLATGASREPPEFAVYLGDRKVGSGTFEYG
jgi:hypothetical protein